MKFNMQRARVAMTFAGAALFAFSIATSGENLSAQGAAQGGRGGGAPAAPAQGGGGRGGRGGQPQGPPPTPRAAAPIDITGNWVAVVTEDWRWRMVTPPKGDFSSVPLNAEGQRVGNMWDPATDGSCQAYGVAGLMRMPTRLQISWVDDDTLQITTDAGQQTRRIEFDAAAQPGPKSLQGFSRGTWERAGGGGRGGGGGPATGDLMVTTNNTTGGWLRKNGAPYSDQTTITEYFDSFTANNGDTWLVQTQITTDPMYLNGDWITSNHFKKEADASKWSPAPCKP
jgi:hypothetical protein